MSAIHAPPSFESDWYPLWLRAWLQVGRHSGRLAELAQNLPSRVIDARLADPEAQLEPDLKTSLAALDAGQADDDRLLCLWACLRTLETRYHRESRRRWQSPPIIETPEGRRLLVPPPTHSTRPGAPEERFPLTCELGVPAVLGLGCRWLALEDEDELDWSPFADLDSVLGHAAIHVGLAPLASPADMGWAIPSTEPLGPDRRVPVRCTGALDGAALRDRVEAVLDAAYSQGVHLLLMPELVIDEQTLCCCSEWLARHNLREPRLRLVVAGSRHCDRRGGFANRCSVLDQLGNLLWEQEKRSPYLLKDRTMLDRLSPGEPVEHAFEPTSLGRRLVVARTAIGRIVTPVCLDYIEGDFWGALGADLYLVPAMTAGLSRFISRAEKLGGEHGATALICNARTDRARCHAYRPARSALNLTRVEGVELFTTIIEIAV